MRPTELIQLAYDICNCTDRSERNRLRKGCPAHLVSLLNENLALIRHQRQRQDAKQKAKQLMNKKRALIHWQKQREKSDKYRLAPSHKEQRERPRKLIPSAGLKACENARQIISGTT